MNPFCCLKTVRGVSNFTSICPILRYIFFVIIQVVVVVRFYEGQGYEYTTFVLSLFGIIFGIIPMKMFDEMLQSYFGASTVLSLLVPALVYLPFFVIFCTPLFLSSIWSSVAIWPYLSMWTILWILIKKYSTSLLPVSRGHRRLIFTGRSSVPLRDLILTVDEDIPSEQQLQELTTNAIPYLSDVQSALEKGWCQTDYFLAGSTVERFGIAMMISQQVRCFGLASLRSLDADLDVMFCCSGVKASFSGQDDLLVVPFISEREGFTGYAQIVYCTTSVEKVFLSSTHNRRQAIVAVQNMPVDNLPSKKCCFNTIDSGPKVSFSSRGPTMKLRVAPLFEADFTICIHCLKWPPMSDWSSRPRYWPSATDLKRIMSIGCHLVAKPAPSDKDETSWRFSFSLAEVELSKLVPDTARKCFLALKKIMKDHLQPMAPELTSYHIKTVFLNTLEKVPVGFWVEDNVEECFLLLLAELRDALLFRNCPHHWFSSINLFQSKVSCFCMNTMKLLPLAKKVERILRNPAPYIFDDGCCCLSPCSCLMPHPIFTPRTIAQLSTIYIEIPFSLDCHGDPSVGDHAGQSSPKILSPRSEAHLHDRNLLEHEKEQVISSEPYV